MKKNLFVLLIAGLCAVNAMAQKAEDGKALRFDFGGGEVAEGYVGVSASDIYSEELGYGFEKGSSVKETIRMPERGNRLMPLDMILWAVPMAELSVSLSVCQKATIR